MKTILVLALVLIGGTAMAQTNAITFSELKSVSGNVLMTNATYHTAVGEKLFFENDGGEHGYNAVDLDTNVLNQLGMSAADRLAAQKRINAQNAVALQTHEQFLQQQAAAEQQAALAQQQAASNAAATTPAQQSGSAGSGNGHKSKKNKYNLPQ